jgi:hypothetical protein
MIIKAIVAICFGGPHPLCACFVLHRLYSMFNALAVSLCKATYVCEPALSGYVVVTIGL